MSKRTLGTIITLFSLVLCCLPGAVLTASSALAFLGMLSAPLPLEDEANPTICLVGLLCVGMLLMLLPLALGLWSWRLHSEEEPAIQVTYVPARPPDAIDPDTAASEPDEDTRV